MIQLIPAEGGAPVKSLDAQPAMLGRAQYLQYSADGKTLYYPITEKGVSNIVRQSVDDGHQTQVTNFTNLT